MGYLDYDSEAAHLAEIEECRECSWYEDAEEEGYPDEYDSYDNFLKEREEGVLEDEELYLVNKSAPVGSKITCAGPLCHKQFIKKSYQQAFCCTKHKDQFWNRREAHFGWRKPVTDL